ncbi:GNAT family N-acetyltransferase [Nostoc sp. MG11]|uniref:GNAT family N-acetyltransferase n=1 Tax=Nostoc sp. MG11 TaxID=2721166 RepID=UPI001D0225EA|nr:GNAT family N-acetyltransferase [Nostoc sp. MG11]
MNIIAETDRLIIRTWSPQADTGQAFYIYSDPEVTRFIITKVDSVESSKNLLKRWITKSQELNNGSGF